MENNIKKLLEEEKQIMQEEDKAKQEIVNAFSKDVSCDQEEKHAVEQPIVDDQKTAISVVDEQEQLVYDEILKNKDFQIKIAGLGAKTVAAEVERREIVALTQEQKNELAKLQLQLNKKTMRDEAKAKHYERKRKAKMVRFGYLYEPYIVKLINPETGELVEETRYKNFTTNNFINRYREFANFYANLADSTKKIIAKTLKIAFWVCLAALIGTVVYFGIKWLLNNPYIQQIIQSNTEETIAKMISML